MACKTAAAFAALAVAMTPTGVLGQTTEIDACRAMIAQKGTSTAAQSGDKTEVTETFSNCADFTANELKPQAGAAQYTSVDVNPASRTRTSDTVPSDFLGFSFEWNGVDELVKSMTPNKAVVQLFKNLQVGGAPVNLLIGGNSAMNVALDKSNLPKFKESKVVITDELLQEINALSSAANARLTLGLPMMVKDTRYAVEFVTQGILKNIDVNNIHSLELGNEPDHWQLEKKCFRANPTYSFGDYMKEYQDLEKALVAGWPADKKMVPLQGPAIAGCNTFPKGKLPCWQGDLGTFADQSGPTTKFVSYHRYGNSGCSKASNLRTLLADPIPGDETKSYDWLERAVNAVGGKQLIWTEGNAFSCGGNACLSKSFATTLWALDNLLEVALRGVAGGYIHAVPGHIYTPFNTVGNSAIEVLPVYYASLAFARLVQSGSARIFVPSVGTTSKLIKVWGIENGGKTHICIIHKDADQTAPISVKVAAGSATQAGVIRLTAPNVFSSDVTFAGQRVGRNGKLKGTYTEEKVAANGGVFTVSVAPLTIAILTM